MEEPADATRELVDAMAARLRQAIARAGDRARPVVRLASPDELREVFSRSLGLALGPGPAPSREAVLAALDAILEYSVHTDHPRFFNQNFAGPDPVGVIGDWLGALLNTTAATYEVAPVFTLMERALLRRLAELAGLPPAGDDAPGIMTAGGSMANALALQLARHARFPSLVEKGARDLPPMRVFTSDQGHYSMRKAAALLGMGTDAVVVVPSDARGRMRVDALREAIDASAVRGEAPIFVNATAGTTVMGAFDPIAEIVAVARPRGVWVHVDGCYGASVLLSPKHRGLVEGVGSVDSLAWDVHKMLGATQQCSALLLREPARTRATFSARADYLFQPDKLHAELDTGDRTFHCGRRADALKAWLIWAVRGEAWLTRRIERAAERATHLRARIEGSGGRFLLAAPPSFSNVCFWWVPPALRPLTLEGARTAPARERLHRLAPRIKAAMQREGSMLCGYQPVKGGPNAFRVLFINPEVEDADVDFALDRIEALGAAL